jgi:hypothetical protein
MFRFATALRGRALDPGWGASYKGHAGFSKGLRLSMSDADLVSLVNGFRARAKEILLRAETMHSVDVCLKLREVAAGYERLARRIEQQEPGQLATA